MSVRLVKNKDTLKQINDWRDPLYLNNLLSKQNIHNAEVICNHSVNINEAESFPATLSVSYGNTCF